ncbi:MAG: PGN_0703 family putative restriction endonuclease [Bacteroidales bacterium]
MTIKELKEKFHTDYNDSSLFAGKARLLQSIWRKENNIPYLPAKFGNYINSEYAYKNESNFLTPKIREFIKNEIDTNEKRIDKNKKVIKKDRLYENLLASQPLAFNLFVELITPDYSLATKVFQRIFGNRIHNIISIEFEISPGRSKKKYTYDRSAFDVFIQYNGDKGKGFIGIEVKYAETLKDKPASFKERYKEVAEDSGKFTKEGIEVLRKMPKSVEQVWRDHLLSLSMIPPVNNDYDEGFFVYLFPKENDECIKALNKYFVSLKSQNPLENGLYILNMETLLEAIKHETNDKWIFDFEDRYLRFEKIDNAMK